MNMEIDIKECDEEARQQYLERSHNIHRGGIIEIITTEGSSTQIETTIRNYRIVSLNRNGALTEYLHRGRTFYRRWFSYWQIDKALGRVPEVRMSVEYPTKKKNAGRPLQPISEELREVYNLWRSGKVSPREAARRLGTTRDSFYQKVKRLEERDGIR